MTVQIGIVLLTFVIFVVLILSNKVKIDLAAMAILLFWRSHRSWTSGKHGPAW